MNVRVDGYGEMEVTGANELGVCLKHSEPDGIEPLTRLTFYSGKDRFDGTVIRQISSDEIAVLFIDEEL